MKIKMLDFGFQKEPFRAHENDAGADVHSPIDIVIKPHETAKIPLGFGLVLPDGYMACVYPRSGLAARGIVCELPPIDSGYRGQIHAIVSNLTDEEFIVNEGMRIGQLVVMPIIIPEFYHDQEFATRDDHGFGSTGLN